MEYAQQTIVDFLSGKLDIVEFRRLYDKKPEIDGFLQKIIDDMKKDPACHPEPSRGIRFSMGTVFGTRRDARPRVSASTAPFRRQQAAALPPAGSGTQPAQRPSGDDPLPSLSSGQQKREQPKGYLIYGNDPLEFESPARKKQLKGDPLEIR